MPRHDPEPPSTAKFSLVRRLAQRIFPFVGVELRTCACKALTSSLLIKLCRSTTVPCWCKSYFLLRKWLKMTNFIQTISNIQSVYSLELYVWLLLPVCIGDFWELHNSVTSFSLRNIAHASIYHSAICTHLTFFGSWMPLIPPLGLCRWNRGWRGPKRVCWGD